jgi:hypothetical protein
MAVAEIWIVAGTWPAVVCLALTIEQVFKFNSDVFGLIGEGKVMAPTILVSL